MAGIISGTVLHGALASLPRWRWAGRQKLAAG